MKVRARDIAESDDDGMDQRMTVLEGKVDGLDAKIKAGFQSLLERIASIRFQSPITTKPAPDYDCDVEYNDDREVTRLKFRAIP